ncbi:MAG: hypothetical protein KME04_13205 [Pleurocapsa minor GSE-CHR-MK-17-07R]|nr:hypothetical protein [Pleurocapsa minor GSE-CHR-MK 17-07R]
MTHKRELAVFVFPTRGNLVDATQAINDHAGVKVHRSAVLARAEDGEVTIFDDDINAVEGAISGGTLGAVMGTLGLAGLGALLLPGVGAIVALGLGALAGGAIGGGIGAGVARVMDLGIKDHTLDHIAHLLHENQVAIVLELDGTAEDVADIAGTLTSQYNAIVIDPDTPAS